MPNFDPNVLANWTAGHWTGGRMPGQPLTGFHFDSRQIGPGQVFVALKSGRRDGHDFLGAAAAAGAAGALVRQANPAVPLEQLVVEDPLTALQAAARRHRNGFRGPVAAVTGSCGKTSTKEFLRLFLGDGSVHATPGNFNNFLGVPITLLGLEPGQHRAAVVEAGISLPGEMKSLAECIGPDLAVCTMVGPAHLEALGSVAGVAREKAVLLEACAGRVYFPASCLAHAPFKRLLDRATLLVESGQPLPIRAGEARAYRFAMEGQGGSGVTLALQTPAGPSLLFRLPAMSAGLARNAALALAVALDMGHEPSTLRERLREWKPARLRGEWVQRENQVYFVDCYNASPASVEDSLAAFMAAVDPALRRLFVLGSMGELGAQSAEWHRRTGALLRLRPGDVALLIGDQAEALAEGLRSVRAEPGSWKTLGTAEEARDMVERFRGAILLKGSRVWGLERLLPTERPQAEGELAEAGRMERC